ncbi:hypothetical protein JTB14_028904 [Gonioctena quinquepunctata]|nr:hypothetical protein JTB14_028904 [Gonioctena quinquepunctata]
MQSSIPIEENQPSSCEDGNSYLYPRLSQLTPQLDHSTSSTADHGYITPIAQEIQEVEKNMNLINQMKILERFNFSDCKPISTPMLKGREILETEKESKKVSNFPYRQAVGALMYLMLGTRPDLAYSIGFLSRSLENPTAEDVAKVKRML